VPFDSSNREEVLACVQNGQFSPPRRVKPETPPALDAVCRKAMALIPGDRYRTALDLADDVEHWLADEPVAAYPDPWPARAARWGRRHRTAVVGAGVFLLSAVVALSITTALVWREQQKTAEQERHAEAERARAEKNFELARDVSFNTIDLMETADPEFAANPALHTTRREILVATAGACRRYLEQQPDDPELRQHAAQVYRYAARVLRLSNQTAAADPLIQDSVSLYKGLMEQYPEEAAYQVKLIETLRDYASVQAITGRLAEASGGLKSAVELVEKLRAKNPSHVPYRRTLAITLLDQSAIEYALGNVPTSQKTAEQSASFFSELLKPPAVDARPTDPLLLALAINRVAVAKRGDAGQIDAAVRDHKEADRRLKALVDKPPPRMSKADILHTRARCMVEQCRTLAKLPEPERRVTAETNLMLAARECENLAKGAPNVTAYREGQADAYLLHGLLREEDKDGRDAAWADFLKSQELLEQLVRESPDLPGNRGQLGRAYAGLARVERAKGNEDKATEWFLKAVASLSQAVAQSPDDVENRRSLKEVQAQQPK
jgi:hypothetical protein